MQFSFFCPTKIFSGTECINLNSNQFVLLGNKALIVTGSSSSKKNGSLNDVIAALDKEGIKYEIYDEVEENPSLATVFQGGQRAKKMGAEFIIGLGGGSPLDAAKAVAILAVNEISSEELMAKKWEVKALPIVAIPTTAGTGSEVTPYAVLTVDSAETKKSISGEDLFAKVAFLDGRYMLNLNWPITANTAVDALTHSVEGYLNKRATVFTDMLALESIDIISKLLRTMESDNISLVQREELLYASMLAGMVIAQTGTNIVHAMGYPLTYYKNLPHGLANGIVLKAALDFIARHNPKRVTKVVKAMGYHNLPEVGQLLTKVLQPIDLKLTTEEQNKYVEKIIRTKNLANCETIPEERDIYEIFRSSNLSA
ncbi:iron-containing alcohol dehydrogenase family protein [Desulfotomaculum defluvii]